MATKKTLKDAAGAQMFYRDGWRYRIKDATGVVLASGRDFKTKAECLETLKALIPEGTPLTSTPRP